MKPKFDYDDIVRIQDKAPAQDRPGIDKGAVPRLKQFHLQPFKRLDRRDQENNGSTAAQTQSDWYLSRSYQKHQYAKDI